MGTNDWSVPGRSELPTNHYDTTTQLCERASAPPLETEPAAHHRMNVFPCLGGRPAAARAQDMESPGAPTLPAHNASCWVASARLLRTALQRLESPGWYPLMSLISAYSNNSRFQQVLE